jgi:putative transposase
VKQKRFNVEQIVAVLKQAEAGVPLVELLRRVGVSQQTFYRWKKQYVGLEVDQVRQLKQLQEENTRLKHLVATVTYQATGCPADNPTTATRFMVSGPATFITGNGKPGPFEAKGPTTLHVCITGGSDVTYSNMTMELIGPASGHFGTQAIHGVVRFLHKDDDDKHDDRH